MPYVKVNDINMYYEIHGDGEPLVLIVGLATDISEWDAIIGWLAKKYMATREREHFRTLYASMHFFS